MTRLVNFFRALLRLNEPPAIPRGDWTVQGSPVEIAQRVLIDWALEVTGLTILPPVYGDPSQPTRIVVCLGERTARIEGDEHLVQALINGLNDRRHTQ